MAAPATPPAAGRRRNAAREPGSAPRVAGSVPLRQAQASEPELGLVLDRVQAQVLGPASDPELVSVKALAPEKVSDLVLGSDLVLVQEQAQDKLINCCTRVSSSKHIDQVEQQLRSARSVYLGEK